MKRIAGLIGAIGLCGCSSLSPLGGAPGSTTHGRTLQALGEHIDRCDRHYQGGVGLGASFTFNIDCKAQPAAPD